MDSYKKIWDNRPAFITIAVLLVITIVLSFVFYFKSKAAKISMENQYRESVYELASSVNNIEISLNKALLTDDPRHIGMISAEIGREAAYAKANLSKLPIFDISLENTQKFLTQISDYTNMLSMKAVEGKKISEDEYNTLTELTGFCSSLNKSLFQLKNDLESSDMSFEKVTKISAKASSEGKDEASANAFSSMEENFISYPTMIYDGPFSDHLTSQKPRLTEGKPEVSQKEASMYARKFLNIENIMKSSDSDGKIPYYGFKYEDNDKQIYVSVTKKGGFILNMRNQRRIDGERVSYADAVKKAEAFLNQHGFLYVKHSYYEKISGALVINFQVVEKGMTIYPELIKVAVALDNGEIVGYDASHYILNHRTDRDFTVNITADEAISKLRKNLTVTTSQLCVIPLDGGNEAVCYEFAGTLNDKEFLYYINAATGREEKIMLVVTDENGTLTV